ncbi:MAG: hypothetical protein A2921_03420 [Candidatus Magasanikbacteria bacterium RIFCSPLOWO2_01_FULL_43_20b]|uniref:Uncharacterized protein n=1 Tax=Candidatus Magasanikbacteria bacterium RIFCSPLOWO2_12_FULL_43_12 TaxID=1798692 RepID=A0A1F6MQQ1_9BACT|nr:MAG: hypothetical protein A3C74_02235 [Candidatus Magasanikbacteria bacterium RIFCSPHIGHO2_02_FULL_44_13]OGH71964.1 MAG: hypothetical protein A3I93_03015 [Candidatus Magasanikbacteria bacterium RIFCSPLOWO2_02_FULL_43_22]OGH73140.1 MAG: hypothetical protein A2921_03420 [Candidatus Magasanikbacteria bacterium RIFCSPLOWO2_01_FULL_43_20b]OGH73967.1 MAG: hypothetical protein A3G00_03620 [Candidatus Magasanikbacteria bacterium RIFCSPLOWO2_12_FULL_43_12]
MNFINLFPSLDIFILFLFVAIVILHLLFIKKSKLLTGLVALYASFVIVLVLPMFNATVLSWLQAHPFGRIAVFVGLILLLYILLSFSNLAEFSKNLTPTQFITSLIYRVALTGLFFTTVIYFLPDAIKINFGLLTKTLFLNLIAMAVWFIIPLSMAFAYRFKTRRGWIE